MKSLLYIGNMLGPHALMSLHSALLAKHFRVFSASKQANKVLRMLDMVGTFLRHQRSVQCVLIDTYSTANFYYAWAIALLCRWYQKPYIAYLHGGNLPARLARSPRMSRAMFAHSLANVAPSGYLKTAFERAGFCCTVVPNFLQIEDYPFQLREKIHPRLLWVRAFEQTYHPEMTLRVFAAIQKTWPEAQLCMVGPDKDGSLGRCQTLAAELGIATHVTFAGKRPKSEWISLSKQYDVFLSTTNFDNTPVSVLEAMALGLPVVSTDVGGMPYLVEHRKTGLLSPKNDLSAMVAHLEELLNKPELAARLSREGRRAVELFDWQQVEKQWLELLAKG